MNTDMYRRIKRGAYATCIGMFLVVLNGALVTKTNSGRGCGSEWPLCQGKWVPTYTIDSIIEYSHRFVTGIVGLLVLIMFIFVLTTIRDRREAVCYATCTLLFTIIQAIMGALAVVFTQSPPVMALHFGFSLLAFSSSFLLCAVLRRYERGMGGHFISYIPIGVKFRYGVWFTLFYTYFVIYLGAFVRHTNSTVGCLGWPLCNGVWIPKLYGETVIAFFHRVAALLLLLLIAVMGHYAYYHYRTHREMQLCGIWTVVLCTAQVGSGAMVVTSMMNANLFLVASMLHTTLICGLFSMLCYMSVRVWQLR